MDIELLKRKICFVMSRPQIKALFAEVYACSIMHPMLQNKTFDKRIKRNTEEVNNVHVGARTLEISSFSNDREIPYFAHPSAGLDVCAVLVANQTLEDETAKGMTLNIKEISRGKKNCTYNVMNFPDLFIKEINIKNDVRDETFSLREAFICLNSNSKYLVQSYMAYYLKPSIFIIMETGVPLLDILQEQRQSLIKLARRFLVHICKGITYLNEKYSIIHGDVKLENIILVGRYFKLIDFELTVKLNTVNRYYGTEIMLPPEVLNSKYMFNHAVINITDKLDMWALGLTVLEYLDEKFYKFARYGIPIRQNPNMRRGEETNLTYPSLDMREPTVEEAQIRNSTLKLPGPIALADHIEEVNITDLVMRQAVNKLLQINPVKRYSASSMLHYLNEFAYFEEYVIGSKIPNMNILKQLINVTTGKQIIPSIIIYKCPFYTKLNSITKKKLIIPCDQLTVDPYHACALFCRYLNIIACKTENPYVKLIQSKKDLTTRQEILNKTVSLSNENELHFCDILNTEIITEGYRMYEELSGTVDRDIRLGIYDYTPMKRKIPREPIANGSFFWRSDKSLESTMCELVFSTKYIEPNSIPQWAIDDVIFTTDNERSIYRASNFEEQMLELDVIERNNIEFLQNISLGIWAISIRFNTMQMSVYELLFRLMNVPNEMPLIPCLASIYCKSENQHVVICIFPGVLHPLRPRPLHWNSVSAINGSVLNRAKTILHKNGLPLISACNYPCVDVSGTRYFCYQINLLGVFGNAMSMMPNKIKVNDLIKKEKQLSWNDIECDVNNKLFTKLKRLGNISVRNNIYKPELIIV